MHYEINVSRNNTHVFATHERSLRTRDETKALYEKFLVAFPASEGYEIRVTRWQQSGTYVHFEPNVEE